MNWKAVTVRTLVAAASILCTAVGVNSESSATVVQIAKGTPLQLVAPIARAAATFALPSGLSKASLVAATETTLLVSSDRLTGIDIHTGRVRWESALGLSLWPVAQDAAARSDTPIRPAGVVGRVLVCMNHSRETVALDIESGRELWRTHAWYVGEVQGDVILYRPGANRATNVVERRGSRSGKVRWSSQRIPELYGSSDVPSLLENTLVLSFFNDDGFDTAYALDWHTGTLLWKVGNASHVFYSDSRLVYLESAFPLPNADLYRPFALDAIDLKAGEVRWTRIYSPEMRLNFTAHPNETSDLYAEAAHVDNTWVWVKVRGTWYRYAQGPSSEGSPSKFTAISEILGWVQHSSFVARISNAIAFVNARSPLPTRHSVPHTSRSSFAMASGDSMFIQAGHALYILAKNRGVLRARLQIPCAPTHVLGVAQVDVVECGAARGPQKLFVYPRATQ